MANNTDIFGRSVGSMLVMDASEAELTVSGAGDTGFVLNLSVNYSQQVTPVATFGKDVLLAAQTPQGQFGIGSVAGSLDFAESLSSATCSGTTMTFKFKTDNCKGAQVTSEALKAILKGSDSRLTLHGAILNQFSIQGQASDAFFSQNVGGMFHFLSK